MNQDCTTHLDRYNRSMNDAKCAKDAACRDNWQRDARINLRRHFDAVEVEAAERNPSLWAERNPLDHGRSLKARF